MTRNKIIPIIYIAAASLMATSCSEWLDVQPRSQVEDTELFGTESGYKEALSGVYSSMVNTSTYAKELTYGFIGMLGQEWDVYYSTQYQDAAMYDYDATYPTNYIKGIWATNYNGIANVNNLLAHIDDNPALFAEDNHAVIKGEALALRAMLHFDLLRCFGVSFAVNPDKPSIPYCLSLDYHVYPQLTVRAVTERILTDLSDAEKLLREHDPIVTGREITELDDNGYLINRQVHLNYYAVKGLEARVYMWAQRYEEAFAAADEVISSGKFTWSTLGNMEKGYDRCLADEHLFALNNLTQTADVADVYFSEGSQYSFAVTSERLGNYFDSWTADYRYTNLFKEGTGAKASQFYVTKYDEPSSSNSFYQYKMPLMRLPEMYLIKSEAQYRAGAVKDACATLNQLREARQFGMSVTEQSDYYLELIDEYRREFLGEGVLFFLYKRLNRPIILNSDVDVVATRAYTFPLPLTETESAERDDNR